MNEIIIKPGEEITQSQSSDKKGDLLATIQDEMNVSFQGKEIVFPKVTFMNAQEALDFLKHQQDILLQHYKENNEIVVGKMCTMIDDIAKGYLNPIYYSEEEKYGALNYQTQKLQAMKDFFQTYTWDLSRFLEDVAKERKNTLLEPEGLYKCKDFCERWNTTKEELQKLDWDDVVTALIKDAATIESIHISTTSNNGQLWAAANMFDCIKKVSEIYKKQEKPLV